MQCLAMIETGFYDILLCCTVLLTPTEEKREDAFSAGWPSGWFGVYKDPDQDEPFECKSIEGQVIPSVSAIAIEHSCNGVRSPAFSLAFMTWKDLSAALPPAEIQEPFPCRPLLGLSGEGCCR